jgi:uncharacterized cupredoxin-like copper-binding protein
LREHCYLFSLTGPLTPPNGDTIGRSIKGVESTSGNEEGSGNMDRKHWLLGIAALVLSVGIGVACDDDDDGDEDDGAVTPAASATPAAVTTPAGDGTVIDVQLSEFSILSETTSVPAGEVTFRATNNGPNDPHELVIIKSDLAPNALPTAEDGSVPEDEVDVIDEIEEFPVGETQELAVELEAGAYVLICNIVEEEDGEIESHYQLGMRRALTVE